MKELKHLIYFESLLEDTNNELIRKAESEGDLALGYTCFHAPRACARRAAGCRGLSYTYPYNEASFAIPQNSTFSLRLYHILRRLQISYLTIVEKFTINLYNQFREMNFHLWR